VLGKYVRENKDLTMSQAIHKMTGKPASVLRLEKRGLLKEGYYADVVVFDPETVIDKATYDNPKQYPEGIEHVFVNGVQVVEKGVCKPAKAGRLLRK
jgi:N-acyl-D-amino-acid deacylase